MDENKDEKLYKYCLRCGRRLVNVEARKLGMGKICYEKMKAAQNKKRKLF